MGPENYCTFYVSPCHGLLSSRLVVCHASALPGALRTPPMLPPPDTLIRCLAAQLALGKPIFGGRTRKQQLEYIFKCCGSPGQGRWPEGNKAPLYRHLRPVDKEGKSLHFKPRLDKVREYTDLLFACNT